MRLTLLPGLAWGNGDLDSNLNRVLNNYKVRGGAVAFFDKVSIDAANTVRRCIQDLGGPTDEFNMNPFLQRTMTEPILRGYGRTASSGSSPKVTPETTFMLASVSKVFAGAAVLALIDQGYIDSLDDDICNVLPAEWDSSACRNPRLPTTPVTWRMLVTHRSSLREDVPSLVRNGDYFEVGYGPIGGYFGEGKD